MPSDRFESGGDLSQLVAPIDASWVSGGAKNFVGKLVGTIAPLAQQLEAVELQDCFLVALDRDEFHLALQPIVEAKTWRIEHYEGLLRYVSEDGAYFTGADIIPLAERLDLVQSLDVFALKSAARMLRMTNSNSVSINVSRRSLDSTIWRTCLTESLAESATLKNQLIIEITETALPGSPSELQNFVDFLREQEVRVAIDDFGSGVTSWEELEKLKVDIIKFDKSITQSLDSDSKSNFEEFLIHSIERAKNRGVQTVAEGVEEKHAALRLADLGIDMLQGYLFGRPKP